MIAKIIAYGRDRDEALGRLRRAMAETTVIIAGGATNKSFVLDLLDQPEVIDASADTGWIDRVRAEGRLAQRGSAIALAAAAIEAYEDAEDLARQRLLTSAHGGRPQVQLDTGRPVELKLRGVGYKVHVGRVAPHRFRVAIAAGSGTPRAADVEIERFDEHAGQILVNGRRFRLVTNVPRAHAPGRGGRRRAPDQPRRGRRGARARARAGGGHAAGGRRRGGGRARRCWCWSR